MNLPKQSFAHGIAMGLRMGTARPWTCSRTTPTKFLWTRRGIADHATAEPGPDPEFNNPSTTAIERS